MEQQFHCSTFKIYNYLYNVKMSWLCVSMYHRAWLWLLIWWICWCDGSQCWLSWLAHLLTGLWVSCSFCLDHYVYIEVSNEGFWNVFYGKRNARYELNNYMHIVSHIAITHNEWPIEHYKYMKTCAEKKHMKITAFFLVRSFALLVTHSSFSIRMHIIDCAYLTLPYSQRSEAKVFW